MDYEEAGKYLQSKKLKKTKLRLALIDHFIKMRQAQSYNDIKNTLRPATDKSTLYRNLATFEEAGLIHRINDQSGIAKYALGEPPVPGREHLHFVCECCEAVYCVKAGEAYRPEVPEGFRTKEVQTILKGTCPQC